MADLLISAAPADQAQAERLGQIFVDRGFSVDWMTLDPAEPGARSAILSRRAAARATLALWSKNSVGDSSVVEEAREGLRRGTLLAARLDDSAPPPEFRAAGMANLATWDGSVSSTETSRLLAELAKLLERTSTRPALAMAAARLNRTATYGAAARDLRPRMSPAAAVAMAAPVAAATAAVKAAEPLLAAVPMQSPEPMPAPTLVIAPEAQPVSAAAPLAKSVVLVETAPLSVAPVQTMGALNDNIGLAPQLAATSIAGAAASDAPILREVKSAGPAPAPQVVAAPVVTTAAAPVAPPAPEPHPTESSAAISKAAAPVEPATPAHPEFAPIGQPKESLAHLDTVFPVATARNARRASSSAPRANDAPMFPIEAAPKKPFFKEPRPRTHRDDLNHAVALAAGAVFCGVLLFAWQGSAPQMEKAEAPQSIQLAKAAAPVVAPQSAPIVLTPPTAKTTTPAPSALPVIDKSLPAPASKAPETPPASKLAMATPPAPKPEASVQFKESASAAKIASPDAAPAPAAAKPIAKSLAPVRVASSQAARKLGAAPKAITAPKVRSTPATIAAKASAKSAPAAASGDAPPQSSLSAARLAEVGRSLDKTGEAAPATIEALAAPKAPALSASNGLAFAAFNSAPSDTHLQLEGEASPFYLPGLAPTMLAGWQPGVDAPAPTLSVPLTESDWDMAPPRIIAQSALSAGDYQDHLGRAHLGEPRAMLSVALMRQTGIGVEQDDAVAFDWMRRAALAKDARALSEVGAYYALGRGVLRDDQRAVRNFALSAKTGAASGQNALGWALATGRGVAQDETQARTLFENAALKGDPLAALNLGRMYADGRGGERDPELSAAWYARAADQGFAPAQYALAVLILRSPDAPLAPASSAPPTSAQISAELAVLRLQQAAAQGLPEAQALLGALYAHGVGVAKDETLAQAWRAQSRQFSELQEAKTPSEPAPHP